MLLAQLSDTHVLDPASDERRYVDNNGRLAQAVAAINDETVTPDAVLATGDLVNSGPQPQYDALVSLLSELAVPVLPIPGNHDDRDRLRAAFPHMPWADAEHASWATNVGGLDIIGLDSIIPGEAGAEIDQARAEWLAAAIDAASGPVLLTLHHPPFRSGIEWMDASGFLGLELLSEVLEQHPGVRRILCGHLHRPITSAIAGIPTQVGISTVQHIGLDFQADASVTLINDPPGFMLHQFDLHADPSGGAWSSHIRFTDTGQAPYAPTRA